jgi:two-component system phosphate regulon sensor histidine kinase PhoR
MVGEKRRAPNDLPAGGLSILVLAAAGASAPLLLAVSGHASPTTASALAIALGALGAALFIRRMAKSPSDLDRSAPGIDAVPEGVDPPFAAMLDGLPEPILLITGREMGGLSGQKFLFANAAARRVLPIQRDQGPLATAIRSPDVLRAVDLALFADGVAEASFDLGAGQPRQWRARAAILDTAVEGRPPLAILTLRDETDVLAHARLRADFLANASHELRTPLASLCGFIETLSGHARDDAAARERFLPVMQAQADRMSRLIESLMNLSSIEQSEHTPPGGEVDLAQAVADVLDALEPQTRVRGVRFERSLPPAGEAMIVGDRDQIIQVVQNLAENALKYSPRGGAVELEVAPVADLSAALPLTLGEGAAHAMLVPPATMSARYLCVGVRDGGPGIAASNLPRLTERFYRVEAQKSGEHSGAGLGLAIVKHIVNRHGGALLVESAPGAGTTFTACFRSLEPGDRAVSPASRQDQNG